MFKFFKHNKKTREKGFTLVELLVAIGLFVIVLTFSLGSVVSVLDAGRKARSLQAVMTNLNFTLEIMSREMKFGTHYFCGVENSAQFVALSNQNCTGQVLGPLSAISFVSSDGLSTIYTLVGSQIQKSIDGGSTYLGVTAAPDVTIGSLKFYVFNSAPQTSPPADYAQPRIIMVVSGNAGNKPGTQTSFIVQTTVSQRKLDL